MSELNHFSILDIFYTPYNSGIYICVHTNNPCHLTCYFTFKKPLKHHTSRIIRGLKVPWGVYFCFVAWYPIEQDQAGDTLYHTFNIAPLYDGNRFWFTFRGTVGANISPSVGPIFEYYFTPGLPMSIILRPTAAGALCSNYLTGTGAPCPFHFQTVNVPPPNQDDNYLIGNTLNHSWKWDTYNIANYDLGKISTVYHYARFKAIGGYAYVRVNSHLLYISATRYEVTRRDIFADWRYYSHEWQLNPSSGLPWTPSDITSLQIGVGLRHTWGVGWSRTGHCSEVYLVVIRGINGCP
jgi:hypothetical protein